MLKKIICLWCVFFVAFFALNADSEQAKIFNENDIQLGMTLNECIMLMNKEFHAELAQQKTEEAEVWELASPYSLEYFGYPMNISFLFQDDSLSHYVISLQFPDDCESSDAQAIQDYLQRSLNAFHEIAGELAPSKPIKSTIYTSNGHHSYSNSKTLSSSELYTFFLGEPTMVVTTQEYDRIIISLLCMATSETIMYPFSFINISH